MRYTRKRTDDDLRVLAGYAVRDPQTGAVVGVLDQLIERDGGASRRLGQGRGGHGRCSPWGNRGPSGNVGTLRADSFHAFKHGGLVTHRPDLEILDQDGHVVDAAVFVWMRKKDEPHARGY